jgi:hypothetical protein
MLERAKVREAITSWRQCPHLRHAATVLSSALPGAAVQCTSPSAREPRELEFHLVDVVRRTASRVRSCSDATCGGTVHELLVGELRPELPDLGLQARDFLRDALARSAATFTSICNISRVSPTTLIGASVTGRSSTIPTLGDLRQCRRMGCGNDGAGPDRPRPAAAPRCAGDSPISLRSARRAPTSSCNGTMSALRTRIHVVKFALGKGCNEIVSPDLPASGATVCRALR